MFDQTERPGVEERYSSASNTSDLSVNADCRGDSDVLIAMGWSPSRLGAALLRLHSEWDVAAKPIKPGKQAIEALAFTLVDPKLKVGKVASLVLANKQAGEWYATELHLLVGKLKSLPDVRRELAQQASKWGMGEAQDKASAVIKYWLDQSCHACHGRKYRLVLGAPALSSKLCSTCQGSGIGATPCGQDGRRLANYLDRCVQNARTMLKKRLRPELNRA